MIADMAGRDVPIRKKLLLVGATTGYQTRVFAEAAQRLGFDLALGTDRCHVLDDPWGDQALALRFEDPAEAAAVVQEWLERPNIAILAPTERHWPILKELIRKAQVRGTLLMDAHLAALAIEHGAALYTNDRDFSRFPGLKWVNPIETP